MTIRLKNPLVNPGFIMLIKERHANDAIALLEERKKRERRNARALDREIRNIRAGERSEETAAYFIDFDLKNSSNWAVLHDLRIEHKGRVAQIDHLLINRTLRFYVLESKSFTTRLKITEHGEFERYISDDDTWEAIESPLAQNQRHIDVLNDLIEDHAILPKRLGFSLKPIFSQIVLVNGKGTITRPAAGTFDTSQVVKGDVFFSVISKETEALGAVSVLKLVTQIVSSETLRGIAENLAAHHSPSIHSGSAPVKVVAPSIAPPVVLHPVQTAQKIEKAAVSVGESADAPPDGQLSGKVCKACGQSNIEIRHGQYGYYWKCLNPCGGNTKISLPGSGKLRKSGLKFYFVASDGAETLFFENRAVS